MKPALLALLLTTLAVPGVAAATAPDELSYLCVSTQPAWMLPPPLNDLGACVPIPPIPPAPH